MQETTTSITINTSQGKTEIIYNGVKYIPDPTIPNRMNIYLMRDNHTFIRVKGTTVTEIIENILATKLKNPDAKQGTLFLLHNDKEIKTLQHTRHTQVSRRASSATRRTTTSSHQQRVRTHFINLSKTIYKLSSSHIITTDFSVYKSLSKLI